TSRWALAAQEIRAGCLARCRGESGRTGETDHQDEPTLRGAGTPGAGTGPGPVMTRAHQQRRRGQDSDSSRSQTKQSQQRIRRPMIWLSLILLLLFLGPVLVYVTGGARLRGDWSVASQAPTGLAPDPAQVPEAVVQVYAAGAFAWRGAFSVHTWVAVKPA